MESPLLEEEIHPGMAEFQQDLPQLRQDPTLRIGTYPSYRALYAFFNSGQAPTDDPTVRQALAHAIPYGDIVTSIT